MRNFNVKEGYLLTFDFHIDNNKAPRNNWIKIEGKCIYDAIVSCLFGNKIIIKENKSELRLYFF